MATLELLEKAGEVDNYTSVMRSSHDLIYQVFGVVVSRYCYCIACVYDHDEATDEMHGGHLVENTWFVSSWVAMRNHSV